MKPIDARTHGVLDYILAVSLIAAPFLFGLSGTAANLIAAGGTLYLVVSLLTNYPLGWLKVLPFSAHGALEVLLALTWIATPWLYGFSGVARGVFLAGGIGLLVVAALTDYSGRSAFMWSVERRGRALDRRHHALPVAHERRVTIERRLDSLPDF